jgi:hypothetical protein
MQIILKYFSCIIKAKQLQRLYPKISLQYLKHTDHFKEKTVKERRVNAFREAGIPETPANIPQS